MAKIRNVSGEPRTVPALGGRLVLDGAVVDCPDELVYNLTCQELWEPADAAAEALHQQGEGDQLQALKDAGVIEPDPEPEFDLATAKVGELKAYAAEFGIDLGEAITKDAIREAIAAALANANDNDENQGV